MSDWKTNIENCGNCAFWPLGGYQHSFAGAEPNGLGGPSGDGSVSECCRNAPIAVDVKRYPGRTAIFPETDKRDYCGEFEQR